MGGVQENYSFGVDSLLNATRLPLKQMQLLTKLGFFPKDNARTQRLAGCLVSVSVSV